MKEFSNYFELFGLPENFEIDLQLLTERYLALQRVVHPDIYATASAPERHLALQNSAVLNEALRTLKDPLARANYLLTQHGFQPSSLSATTSDAEFLMEQMQLREDLATAKDQQAIAIITNKLQHQYELLMQTLANELRAKRWMQSQEILHKLQFLTRLRRNIEALD